MIEKCDLAGLNLKDTLKRMRRFFFFFKKEICTKDFTLEMNYSFISNLIKWSGTTTKEWS